MKDDCTAAVTPGVDDAVRWFGFRLRSVRSLGPRGAATGSYSGDYLQRSARFLACLLDSGDERQTYELRFLGTPSAVHRDAGCVEIALLARVEAVDEDMASRLAQDRLDLVESLFDDYEFELLGRKELRRFLGPFSARSVTEITRRYGYESLDTLRAAPRPARPIGFTASPPAPPPTFERAPQASVLHVFPFVPAWDDFNSLFRLLLRQNCETAICVRLRPTRLTEAEEDYLEREIELCERYTQMPFRDLEGDPSTLYASLRGQAQSLQAQLVRQLRGLKDDAGLLTVTVASPDDLSPALLDALGSQMSTPAGGLDDRHDLGGYFAGGYQIRKARDPGGFGLKTLDLELPVDELLHPDARRLPYLFDSFAASRVFRLPPAPADELTGVETQHWRARRAPRILPEVGVLIGTASLDTGRPVRIGANDRLRHVYAVGQTGTGKTTLLKTMILDDVKAGRGLCVIDPHGDLYQELVDSIPANRQDDVVLVDPTDVDCPVGINLLEYQSESQRHFIVQEFAGILNRLLHDEFGAAAGQMAGPVFFQHTRMNMLLAMSNPQDPGTLVEFCSIFEEPDYWKRWLPLGVSDVHLDRWVQNVLSKADYFRSAVGEISVGSWISSKFTPFVFDPMLRNIFGQKHSTIDFREAMDTGQIVLVNLAKGQLTEPNARFFGMVLLAKIQAAAMSRVEIPKASRRDFFVYIDEFQSVATESFVTLLSEARKFGLALILSNQFVSQLENERISEAILGNVGTMIAFRVGSKDAEIVEREMAPAIDRSDLVNLPNWTAYVSTLIDGQVTRPFTVRTLHSDDVVGSGDAVRRSSRAKYGGLRSEVEREIRVGFTHSTGSGRSSPIYTRPD